MGISSKENKTLQNLLDLDGVRFVIDDVLGLWVKFNIKQIATSTDRPHGIRYELTLHDRFNKRIMGFDNAHAIEYGAKKFVSPARQYDHWHHNENDTGQPYMYVSADQLMTDFWCEVDKVLNKLEEK